MNFKIIKKYFFYLVAAVVVANVFSTDWSKTMTETGVYAPVSGEGISVSYIDVGTADCAFVTAEGYNLIIDAALRHNAEEITTFLDRYNIDKLDMVIASHNDSDHIGGMGKLLDEYEVEKFITFNSKEENNENSVALDKLNNSIEENNISTTYTKAGDIFRLGNMVINVLSPHREYDDSNDDSLVVKITYGETDFLFTGDASKEVEEYLLTNNIDISCDVLKVSHHGSKTATTEEFLKRADPSIAVVPVGENFKNLPNVEVINRLKDFEGLKLYRSDYNGTVTVWSDGEEITVSTEK